MTLKSTDAILLLLLLLLLPTGCQLGGRVISHRDEGTGA